MIITDRRFQTFQTIVLFVAAIAVFHYAVDTFLSARRPESAQASTMKQEPNKPVAKIEMKKEECKTRFVFIDLGANRADSIKVFLKEPNTKFEFDFPKPAYPCTYADAEAYLFEANPVFNGDLVRAKQELMVDRKPAALKKLDLYPSTIVWIEDKTMPFFLDTVNPEHDFWGSSVKANAADAIRSGHKSVNLTAVDIANFILKRFLPSDFVVVKMDIEGAEWDVVPHLASMGAGINIDYLLIEWHWGSATEQQKKNKDSVLESLKKQGVQIPEYDSNA